MSSRYKMSEEWMHSFIMDRWTENNKWRWAGKNYSMTKWSFGQVDFHHVKVGDFFKATFNSQLPILLTMAACAAHGVTSTSRPLTGTSFTSLGSAITSLHPTANLPMRTSTSRLGVQWWKMLRRSLTSSWSWKEQWLNWPMTLSCLMANRMFITWNCNHCSCSQWALWVSVLFPHLISHCSWAAGGLRSFLKY